MDESEQLIVNNITMKTLILKSSIAVSLILLLVTTPIIKAQEAHRSLEEADKVLGRAGQSKHVATPTSFYDEDAVILWTKYPLMRKKEIGQFWTDRLKDPNYDILSEKRDVFVTSESGDLDYLQETSMFQLSGEKDSMVYQKGNWISIWRRQNRKWNIISDSFNLVSERPVSTPQKSYISENSYRLAREVLDAGIQALGGRTALEAAQNFSLKMCGKSYQIFQATDPELPFEGWDFDRTTIVDSRRDRFLGEEVLRRPNSDYIFGIKRIINGSEKFEIIVEKKWALPQPNASISAYRNFVQLLPHNVLAEALQRAATLRWLGNEDFKGKRQDVITYATPSGQQITLFFDSQTRLLTKYESLYTRNTLGDAVAEFVYTGYRNEGATKVPLKRIGYTSGILTSEADYKEVNFDFQAASELFALPPGTVVVKTVESQATVKQLAKDVYVLQNLPGSYNVFFVAFNDYILVAEAPETNTYSGISDQALAMIKETLPGKPIKYLVLTHHHGDHAGGARAFIADGANLVTTPGNRRFVERLASAKFSFSPDALARNPRQPVIEILENKKRVFSDDKHRVEIYDIGAISHAKEMVIVYLPKEKILFQSDLFNPVTPSGGAPISEDDPYHGIDTEDTVSLMKSIRRLGLEVEKIVGSHGRIGTAKELIEFTR